MSTDSITTENTILATAMIDKISLSPLLPRSSWNSQMAFLRAVFRAKKALDRIENETK
ncbi:MAG: hypothetical protein HWQ35_05950 [Nostoc sp. NMS1]|uniref:hypothetical protein n=1 Tax=unclassified Nostoc TaxID=2593658 RepID=UPI0025DAA9B6|nr:MULTISPECIES: hypothetical protein [unclassified Nostoc]MBN3906105.1 hypothetical protein [Nostoc sp. NMS1]MBN3991843.1 hypothetical protein [Nostoc sp. NMS2]